jgi:hypothetical protein
MTEQISDFDDYVNINGENTRIARDSCIDAIRKISAPMEKDVSKAVSNEIALQSLLKEGNNEA